MNTFATPVVHAARRYADALAFIDVESGMRHTFAELRRWTDAIGDDLRSRGVRRGDRVAVLADASSTYAALYLAAPAHGFVIAPLNSRYTDPELLAAIGDSSPQVIYTDRELDPEVRAAVPHVVDIGELTRLGAVCAGVVRDGSEGRAAEHEPDEDAVAAIFYTGGTTDRAKGVALSHRNTLADALSVIIELELTDTDRWLVMSPMFHAAGSWNIAPCVWVGATQVILPRFDADAALAAIAGYGITKTFGVPTMLQARADAQARVGADVSSLRLLGHGGAPATRAVVEQAAAMFPTTEICGMYGATEMAPLGAVFRHQEAHLGTPAARASGYGAVGVSVEVHDDTGAPAAPGELGEIVVTGPNIMVGYWGKPEATAAVLHGHSYRSGDLGYLDEWGRLVVVDRIKDMIITGGENVYGVEVEDVLAAHPSVMEAAVLGVPDERWGELVVAVVVMRGEADHAALDGHCRAALAAYKVPRRYVVRTEPLPRTAAGKLLKRSLREELAAGTR